MGKQFWMGLAAGVAVIWVAKNIPGVKETAAPLLAKAGI